MKKRSNKTFHFWLEPYYKKDEDLAYDIWIELELLASRMDRKRKCSHHGSIKEIKLKTNKTKKGDIN